MTEDEGTMPLPDEELDREYEGRGMVESLSHLACGHARSHNDGEAYEGPAHVCEFRSITARYVGETCGHKRFSAKCAEDGLHGGCWAAKDQCSCEEWDRLEADLRARIADLQKRLDEARGCTHAHDCTRVEQVASWRESLYEEALRAIYRGNYAGASYIATTALQTGGDARNCTTEPTTPESEG